MTDLVAVVRRDGQFSDAQILEHELHDDLRIEMEIVSVFLEGNPRQRLGRVKTIARVELGELGPKHPVLETGQDLVADPFVEWHSASASGPLIDHSRAEDRVCFTGEKRSE